MLPVCHGLHVEASCGGEGYPLPSDIEDLRKLRWAKPQEVLLAIHCLRAIMSQIAVELL